MIPPAARRSDAIDLLRAVAVLGTLFHHTLFAYTNPKIWSVQVGGHQFFPFLFGNGWLGVNLFFILSGFVLYRPMIATDSASIWRYYIHRAWRLWPLLFLFTFFFSFAQSGSAMKATGEALFSCSGLNNLLPAQWFPRLGATWSLGVEILFSLLLPGLIILQQRLGFWRISWAILIFCLVYRASADALWFRLHPDWGNPLINPLKDNILGRLDDFVIGMMAARLCAEGGLLRARMRLFPALVVLAATSYGWNYVFVSPRSLTLSVLVSVLHLSFSLSSLVVIYRLYLAAWTESPWLKPMVVVGQMCYSIYLTQALVRNMSNPALDLLNPGQAFEFLLITFGFSFFCFVMIEARGLKRRPTWLARFEPFRGESKV